MVKTAERQLGCRKMVASFRGASAASLLGGTTGGNFTQANNTKLTSRRIRWISEVLRQKRYLHEKTCSVLLQCFREYYWSITGKEMKCSLKRPCGTNVSHHILFAVLVVSPSSGFHQNHEPISTALHARLLQKRIHQACRFLWRVSVLVSSKWELTTSFANLVRSHKLTWIKFFS